ncbi:hypothetical protein OHB26_31420 [Nocardia sp. NBC_01503]|uniref:hypothetical protein n=1 Tax=Nocardia sp. NBC_01503 TaxID=2975997 RepID=UPI002E7C143A|nr:hypothetical protein [Nocardia sp. NBC_01503]WTL31383.1 hypothetical protein OHB26_31420 [Nocardia sp. NBC_01503]
MKANTSLSLDGTLLEQSKEVAAQLGIKLSTFVESALRDKLLANSAQIAADYERARGRDTDEHFAEAEAERAAMVEAIRADGAAW